MIGKSFSGTTNLLTIAQKLLRPTMIRESNTFLHLHIQLYTEVKCAFEYCAGKYLAFLDCDDLWMNEKLEKQVAILENDDNIVLVYSNTIFFNSDQDTEGSKQNHQPSGYIFRENMLNYKFSLETVMVRMKTVTDNSLFAKIKHGRR